MRISTGIKGLDPLIEGGIPENTVVLISGNAGTGKTLFALSFAMDGVKKGENVFFITLNEGKADLLRAAGTIKTLKELSKYVGKRIILEEITPDEVLDVDYIIKLVEAYPKVDRIIIDNVNKLLLFARSKREFRIALSRLVKYLREKSRASLLLCETTDDTVDTGNGESYECDGVINLAFLELEEEPVRILKIYKMRYTDIPSRKAFVFSISKDGLKIEEKEVI